MDAFDRIATRTPDETWRLVSKMLDVAGRIHTIFKQKGMTQKDLAVALHKSESEISKGVSGSHNLDWKQSSVLKKHWIRISQQYVKQTLWLSILTKLFFLLNSTITNEKSI